LEQMYSLSSIIRRALITANITEIKIFFILP
jgi:hypothetical protein